MPSGRGSGHSIGGHAHSHSSGHFGGYRSAGSRSYRPTMRWRPHTTVIFGRSVYLGAGRARATSILGILIVFALFVAFGLGLGWYFIGQDVSTQRGYYESYRNLALRAAETLENEGSEKYIAYGTVYDYEQYSDSGKYMLYYTFKTNTEETVYGFTYYVYDYARVMELLEKKDKLVLAIDSDKFSQPGITSMTDSVPLDYKDTTLKDDAQYMDILSTRNGMRAGCCVAIGVTVLMVAGAILVPLTAAKATAEQMAESNKTNNSANVDNQNATATGTWRCSYCNTLNDSAKNSCDGCGAKRQK